VISDAEIHLYKLSDLNLKPRIVQIKRKKFVDRVKCIVILYEFIEFLRLNKESGGVFSTPLLLAAEKEYPFRIPRIGWENWMWEYLLDKQVWEEFLKNASTEYKEYPLSQIIGMKPTKLAKLMEEFNKPFNNQ
jgi:hypothetical protein